MMTNDAFIVGKLTLVTGAGHGIGRELALQLSALGARLVLWDINKVGSSSGKHVPAMYTPLNPTFIEKTGVCRGTPIFLIFDPKHTLWVLVRTASARQF